MGHLFQTTSAAISKRLNDPEAQSDVLAHWLQDHEMSPEQLSLRQIEAQTNVNVGAGAEPVSSK